MGAGRDGRGPGDSPRAGPAAARMVLGGRLRRLREARGISREAARGVIRGSPSKLSRLELGRTGFKLRDVADLLTFYGVSDQGERAALLSLAEQANAQGWLRAYSDIVPGGSELLLELEQAAALIRTYGVQFVPDLLRTEDYARAVVRIEHPEATAVEVERRVGLLAKRQEILCRSDYVRLWFVLDEAALRRRPGGPVTMRSQLHHLIENAERSHITIQVMPFSTGVAAGGPITLLRFAERELADLVSLDQLTSALYPDKPADIQHYTQVMDRLSMRAEQPSATVAFLRRVLDEL